MKRLPQFQKIEKVIQVPIRKNNLQEDSGEQSNAKNHSLYLDSFPLLLYLSLNTIFCRSIQRIDSLDSRQLHWHNGYWCQISCWSWRKEAPWHHWLERHGTRPFPASTWRTPWLQTLWYLRITIWYNKNNVADISIDTCDAEYILLTKSVSACSKSLSCWAFCLWGQAERV